MKRINIYSLGINILIVILIFSIFSNLLKNRTFNNKLKVIVNENIELKKKIENIKKDIQYAETPEYTEKIAREKLDMIKEGDFIIILDER
jgi:cell division protein FtsL